MCSFIKLNLKLKETISIIQNGRIIRIVLPFLQTVLFPGARNKVKNLLGACLSRTSTKHKVCGDTRAQSHSLKGGQD